MKPVCVVTGGSRGIGAAIAARYAKAGYRVAIASRNPPKDRPHAGIEFFPVDVSHLPAVSEFVRTVVKTWGRIDVYVNNAGVSRWKAITDITPAFVHEVLDSTLLGTLWGCSEAAKVMKRGASILNVSSLAGKRGSARNSVYCAAKFGVNGLTQALAKELGPRGIRVNAVCPVYVKTPSVLKALQETGSPAAGRSVSSYLKEFTQTQTALGRLPTATDIANLLFFLSSPEANAITGQCINIDCGVLPQ